MSFELDSKMAILDLLLETFASHLHRTNSKGQTALHTASWAARSDIVIRLCALGLDPKAVDSNGDTPLDLVRRRRRDSGILDMNHLLVKAKILKELDRTEEVLQKASHY